MQEQGLDLSSLSEAKQLYAGSVRDAAQLFPANVNVAVALSLAGVGPDLTQYQIWADPEVERNTHVYRVESDESNFEVRVAGVPSATNPATGALTPLSALRLLSVCDSESGEGLFERVWRWPEGADPKGIGNLVRSFFLVARQLDHGMISRVVFEAPEDEAALVPHAGIGEAMEMLCTRNERVVVAVFHESRGAFADEDDEEAREVHVAMRQLVEQARELWSPDVSRADFKTTVDRLCARIVGLPPPPPDPRQPSPPPRPKSM